jgi:hypothetical protein
VQHDDGLSLPGVVVVQLQVEMTFLDMRVFAGRCFRQVFHISSSSVKRAF